MARLERAENRVTSLESQLEHNSRSWAKEKHELTVRLQEHRNGIMRTSGPRSSLDALMVSMSCRSLCSYVLKLSSASDVKRG